MIDNDFDISYYVLKGLKLRGSKLALKSKDEKLSGNKVAKLILNICDLLSANGLSPGDRVILINDGDIFFPIFYHAIVYLRGVVVPCQTKSNLRFGHEYLIGRTRPKFIISRNFYSVVDTISIHKTPYLLNKLSNGNCKMSASLNNFGVASLMFTSGTTGLPKGVLVTHKNLCSTLKKNICFQSLSPDTIEFNTLPLTHSFGLGQLNATLAVGGMAIIFPGLANIGRMFKVASADRVTSLPITPAGLQILTDRYCSVFADKFAGLKTIMVNSAPLPPEISRILLTVFPKTRLLVYYGLTEASRSTFADLTNYDDTLLTSVGKPLGNTTISVQDSNSEIIISGDNVSPGYFFDCDTPIQENIDGKLASGDKGKLDTYGRLFVIGRLFDEINIGGYKIDPLEVERISIEMDGIDQACLTCIDGSSKLSETVLLISSNEKINTTKVREDLKRQLEAFKVPNLIYQVQNIPTFESGKLNRQKAKSIMEEIFN